MICNYSISMIATAPVKMGTTAIAKIKGILWGNGVKATGTLDAARFGVCRRSIEHVSKMLALRGFGENLVLLLSLK